MDINQQHKKDIESIMATLPNFYLEFDSSGINSANLVSNEPHILTSNRDTKLIIPKYGAFYSGSLVVYSVNPDTQALTELSAGTHYLATEMLHKVTKLVGKSVCTVILILPTVAGNQFEIRYQALGGHDQVNRDILLSNMNALAINQGSVNWEDIANKPKEFPPAPHLQDALDLYGLEYVTDQLDQIKYAINTGDDAIHDSIIVHLESEKDGFFDKYNNELYTRVDTITALTKSAEDSLKILSVELNDVVDRFEVLKPKITQLYDLIADYKHLNGNDRLANVANLLCKREFDKDGTLMDVPAILDDLYLYLDASTYDSVNYQWLDKRGTGMGFSATSMHAPEYGPSYTRPGLNALKFTNGKWMFKNSEFALDLVKGRTIIAVMGHRNASKRIEMPILSNANRKLTIDTESEVAAIVNAPDGTNVCYTGKTSKTLNDDPFVTVVNLASREQDCLNLNNTPYSYYRAPNNIEPGSLNLDAINENMQYLGHPTLNQDAEIFALMAYNRELSKVEMHAVLTYIRLKYGCNVNYLTNPSFEEGSTNFGSALTNYPDFTLRDCFQVTDDRIAFTDTQNTYSDPDFADPLDIRLDNGKYMLVVSKNPTLSFWNQEVLLEPNTRYEFKYSIVYGLVNPPIIRLKVNGLWHSKAYTLNGSRSVVRHITYTFVTGPNPVNTLELFNLNTATTGNSFGIDQMSLVRMIYAQTN